jgi:hypothetical protein
MFTSAYLLDIEMTMNGGGHGPGQNVENIALLLGELLAFLHVLS